MSETPNPSGICPVCGSPLPDGARFCPVCGTRVESVSQGRDENRDAIDATLDEGVTGPDQPTVQAPIVSSPIDSPPAGAPPADPIWAATAEQWPTEPATVTATNWRRSRTFWVIVAVFGFIVFCCCGILFTLFIVAARDSSFQANMSLADLLTALG